MTTNSEICKARTLFITRGILNRKIIPTNIIYSWVRSKLHNISFELLDVKASEKQFDILTLDTIGSGIIKYLRTIKSEESIIYLSNSSGTVVFNTDVNPIDLPPFTDLSEESIGTNAGGIAVITGESITVKGCEHYSKSLVNYMSSSIVIEETKASEAYIVTLFTPIMYSKSHERIKNVILGHYIKREEEKPLLTVNDEKIEEKLTVNPVKTLNNDIKYDDVKIEPNTDNVAGCKVFTLSVIERNTIQEALIHFNWNLKKSAEALGIGRSTLYRKIKEYDLNQEQ